MPTNGMTIDSLNTVSSLTAQDEVPVWDKEASGEHTRKITAQNMANSVKSLASLPNTTEMNTAIEQSTACKIVTGTMSVAIPNSGTVAANFTGLVPSSYKVRGGLFMIGGYQLPYLNGGTYTFVRTITAEGVVTIDNTASGWGTQTVAAVLFLVKR